MLNERFSLVKYFFVSQISVQTVILYTVVFDVNK
jgi:hypothetical protein